MLKIHPEKSYYILNIHIHDICFRYGNLAKPINFNKTNKTILTAFSNKVY